MLADLRYSESISLINLAVLASGAEKEALLRRAFAVQVLLNNVVLRRILDDTLLPGTMREEEIEYEARKQLKLNAAQNKPAPAQQELRGAAVTMGYNILLAALVGSLNLLTAPHWSTEQSRTMGSFVFQGLDVIPRTAGVPKHKVAYEDDLVTVIEQTMNPRLYDPAFCAAVLRKWRSDAVRKVLRARGSLRTGIRLRLKTNAEFKARERADVAKHGLRDCALPSCSETEKTVKEFAVCTGCRTVVYCCLEHQALDWKAHKKACREEEAARLAEEEDGKGGVEEAADTGSGEAA